MNILKFAFGRRFCSVIQLATEDRNATTLREVQLTENGYHETAPRELINSACWAQWSPKVLGLPLWWCIEEQFCAPSLTLNDPKWWWVSYYGSIIGMNRAIAIQLNVELFFIPYRRDAGMKDRRNFRIQLSRYLDDNVSRSNAALGCSEAYPQARGGLGHNC